MHLPDPPPLPTSKTTVARRWRQKLFGNGLHAAPAIVWIIGFLGFLNVYSMQSVLPMVMQDFNASPLQAGATVGATVLAIALVSPFIGMLSDALGRKVMICSALFALTLPTALIPLADSLHAIVVLRFMQGLAVPGIVVVLIAYLSEEFDTANLARMTATYVGGTVMGGFCGRFITGHAGDILGWRAAFLVLAVLNLLGALLVLRQLPPSRHFVPHRDLRAAFRTLGQHLSNRRFLVVCAIGFCVLFSLVGSFTYINLHLAATPFNLSSAGLANLFCVYLIGVVVTPMAARHVVRLGFLKAVLFSLVFSATGLLLTLLPSLGAVVLGLAVCSTGVFVCQSAAIGHIAHTVTSGRSLATGIYYLSYYSGGAAGTWIAGMAYEGWHWSGSVTAIIAFQLLAAAIALTSLQAKPGPTAAPS